MLLEELEGDLKKLFSCLQKDDQRSREKLLLEELEAYLKKLFLLFTKGRANSTTQSCSRCRCEKYGGRNNNSNKDQSEFPNRR